MSRKHPGTKKPAAAATANGPTFKALKHKGTEQMNLNTPKSIAATLECLDGATRKVTLRGRRALIFLRLIRAGKKGLRRQQVSGPNVKLSEYIGYLRKKPIDIDSVGNNNYDITYVLRSIIVSLEIRY